MSPRFRSRLLLAAATVASATGCATGPRFRPTRALAGASDGVSVEITGLESRVTAPGIAIAAGVSAPDGTVLREVSLALPRRSPCEDRDQTVAVVAVDDVAVWQRPLPVAGTHRLVLRFAETMELQKRLSGPLAIDLATERAGAKGCLRIAVQEDDERATWTPASPWLAGLRLDAAPFAFGVRAGRFLGLVAVGIEETISARWNTAALVATAHVFAQIAVEVSYAGSWALPGGPDPAGTFRNGPRARIFLSGEPARRYDGRWILFAGPGIEVGRRWATDTQPAATTLVFGLSGWVNVSAY